VTHATSTTEKIDTATLHLNHMRTITQEEGQDRYRERWWQEPDVQRELVLTPAPSRRCARRRTSGAR
jgi:hypothetical protein